MVNRQLYWLGGSAAFEAAAEVFVPACGGHAARIAILMQGGDDWENYIPLYERPLLFQEETLTLDFIVPQPDGTVAGDVFDRLQDATGIFIGGGHTPTYQRLYTQEPLRSWLRAAYAEGKPFAGVASGALIMPEVCAFILDETDGNGQRLVAGLGLISDCLLSVYFSEYNGLPHLLQDLQATGIHKGWGVDDAMCAVFTNEHFDRALGRGGAVYEIDITDATTLHYQLTRHQRHY